jgi:hypothetical protein
MHVSKQRLEVLNNCPSVLVVFVRRSRIGTSGIWESFAKNCFQNQPIAVWLRFMTEIAG